MNTSLHDLMSKIENIEFDARMNIFSGTRIFMSALQGNATIQQLTDELAKHPDARQEIFDHLLKLLDQNDDLNYAHPYDVALSTYLYALDQTDVALASEAAKILSQRKDLAWSRRLAHTIQENHKVNIGPVE